jgi:hypothetical protein
MAWSKLGRLLNILLWLVDLTVSLWSIAKEGLKHAFVFLLVISQVDSEIFHQIHVKILNPHFSSIVFSCKSSGGVEQKLFHFLADLTLTWNWMPSEENIW